MREGTSLRLGTQGKDELMYKKRIKLGIICCLLGSILCFTGCGADVNAVIPKSGFGYGMPEGEGTVILQGQPIEQDMNKLPEQPKQENNSQTQNTPEQNIVSITISAAGDCSLGNHIEQDYNSSFNQTYDTQGGAEYFLRNVKEIFAADDMTIVNLEGVLTTSDAAAAGRTYNIKGDPSYAKILTEGSVEAVSMANNHRLDFGSEGTKDTEAALNAENIVYAYDKNVAIYEAQGIRIGYVSVNEVAWGQGSEELVAEGIDKLKEAGVDLILVACHWGIEKDNYPEVYQQKLGRKCIDMGADLVIGHHPHVLQGIEEYKGKLILHSLGNFCFGANRNPTDKDTMIFQQTFTFVDGELSGDMDALVIPCSVSSVSNRNNFQPTPLAADEATRVINRLNTYSADMGIVISEEGIVQVK